jgi:hypothetical protein
MLQQFGGGAPMSDADSNEPEPNPYVAQLEEQIRHKGIRPITSVHELAADIFESDEELDDFLAQLYVWRHSPENFSADPWGSSFSTPTSHQ